MVAIFIKFFAYFEIKLGINIEISGTYVISSRTAKFTSTNTQTPRTIAITGLFKVDEATKISNPKGGVIIPMQIFRVTINPK